MLGWSRRWLFFSPPFFLPQGIHVRGQQVAFGPSRYLGPAVCLLLTFALATAARLLELPFWDNNAYRIGQEYLLATHDAYHWIAGAEGFEFGAGHPMSELARMLSVWTGYSPAQIGFWLPPFMSGLLAVAVFLWGWGLGHPLAGMAAGVLASLAPAFCARTLLGFYDTDLVVLLFAVLLGLVPALWISPWLAGLPEILLASVLRRIKRPDAGTPGVKEDSPLSMLFSPWFFGSRAPLPGVQLFSRSELERSILSWPWLLLLILSGLSGHAMQDWHSLFPYLIRYSALVPPLVILIAGPRGGRGILLAGALCHALPLLLGWPGAVAGAVYASALILTRHKPGDSYDPPVAPEFAAHLPRPPANSLCWRLYPPSFEFRHSLARSRVTLLLLWAAILYLAFDAGVFEAMQRSFFAYVNRSGDIASTGTPAADPIVFPSVAQSIIEVQTISLGDLFAYIYPIDAVTIACFAIFALRLLFTPVFVWFAPLLALSLLSLKMGARMTLFGPPVLMLALCLEGAIFLEMLFLLAQRAFGPARKTGLAQEASETDTNGSAPRCNAETPASVRSAEEKRLAALFTRGSGAFTRLRLPRPGLSDRVAACVAFTLRLTTCLLLLLLLARPLVALLPDYTQGPIISRAQAEGLAYLKEYSPSDSLVWNWWDWGYATHHFARRHTIADGARHGGPSLYLPAAVYTTADARFARQIIKYTALKGNVPGNVFAGLSGREAQQLMRDLGNQRLPLINAPGKQYLVASFELLRLGLWVTRYGSWNFETKAGSGSLMNNLSAGLTFNMDNGIILSGEGQPVYAASISLLDSRSLERMVYNRYGAYHFIFSTRYLDYNEKPDILGEYMRELWQSLRPDHAFASQLTTKLAMDEVFYNTMMVQLLLCPSDDPAISPYFRLVFDNRFTRIYEVL